MNHNFINKTRFKKFWLSYFGYLILGFSILNFPLRSHAGSDDELGGTIRGGIGTQFSKFGRDRETRFKEVKNENPRNLGGEDLLDMAPLIALLKQEKKSEFSTPTLARELLSALNINLDEITVTPLPGGFVSGTIYRIEGMRSEDASRRSKEVFYLKYLRPSLLIGKGRTFGEVWNIRSIRDLITQGRLNVSGFDLVLPFIEGQYTYKKNYQKKNKLFTISPGAEGQSLTEIVRENIQRTPVTVNQAFREIGEALGIFQSTNLLFPKQREPMTKADFNGSTAPAHGDFHSDNIYWASETGKVSLIDTETLAYSFDKEEAIAPLSYDIFYLIQQASRRFTGDELESMKGHEWQAYKEFIDGYITSFPALQQRGVAAYLESCLRHPDEIKFTDIFRRIFGKTATWKKSPNQRYSRDIISALQSHLSSKIDEYGNQVVQESDLPKTDPVVPQLSLATMFDVVSDDEAQASTPSALGSECTPEVHELSDDEALQYRANYPDLAKAYPVNDQMIVQLQNHWKRRGMKEGRSFAKPLADEKALHSLTEDEALQYRANYPDLAKAYPESDQMIAQLQNHWKGHGMKEGRSFVKLLTAKEALQYRANYPDLAKAYPESDQMIAQLQNHWKRHGMKEGRSYKKPAIPR